MWAGADASSSQPALPELRPSTVHQSALLEREPKAKCRWPHPALHCGRRALTRDASSLSAAVRFLNCERSFWHATCEWPSRAEHVGPECTKTCGRWALDIFENRVEVRCLWRVVREVGGGRRWCWDLVPAPGVPHAAIGTMVGGYAFGLENPTLMFVGTCVSLTALSVVLTCWPPAPLDLNTSILTCDWAQSW